jgi:hypothetical protein
MAMPEEFRLKVGALGMETLLENLEDTYADMVASNNAKRDQIAAGKYQCKGNDKKGAPSYSGAQIGSLLLVPLGQVGDVVNDKGFKAEILNKHGLNGIKLPKVKLTNDRACESNSRDQQPTKRNPTIEELVARPPNTFFAITVIMEGKRRTHCITLLNNADGTHTFVDPGRRGFYEATPESFKELGFEGVSDTREVLWCALEPKTARAKHKRKQKSKCQPKAMCKRLRSGQDFSSSSSSGDGKRKGEGEGEGKSSNDARATVEFAAAATGLVVPHKLLSLLESSTAGINSMCKLTFNHG